MSTKLTQFVCEMESAFIQQHRTHLFVSKYDNTMQKLVYPKFLTKYGERSTLLQTFTLIKNISNAIYIKEANKLVLTMTIYYYVPKYEVKSTFMQGILDEIEVYMTLNCWKWQKNVLNKKDYPDSSPKNDTQHA